MKAKRVQELEETAAKLQRPLASFLLDDTHPELQKIGVKKIAKALKRTPGATGVKAAKLGVSLDTRG
jgi:hypothetical protein